MRKKPVVALASKLALLALVATGDARAETWIEASPTFVAPGESVAIRVLEGEPFAGRPLESVGLPAGAFQRIWRRGRRTLDLPAPGAALSFRASEPGVHLLALGRSREGGFDSSKALIVVGDAPVDDPLRYSELGHRLEIVPQSDPVELVRRGGTLEVQVLLEREPLAGVTVTAVAEADPQEGSRRGVTDEIGLARVRLDRAGRWLVTVEHRAGRLRSTATLALAVRAAAP